MLSLLVDKDQFRSLLQFSSATNIDYKTVHTQIGRLRACAIDKNGCTVPFFIPTREEWQKRYAAVRSNLSRFMVRPHERSYPYLPESEVKVDGADLMMFVNKLVPRWVPDFMRADICQDMIVAILSGETTREKIKAEGNKYLTKVFQAFPWKYKWSSFDAPRNDEDDRTLHDLMSADDLDDHFIRVHR